MPVSEEVRRIVFARDDGKCQFFHHVPTDGTEYCHVEHQGMGGAPEHANVNQADNGLVACRACHSMFHQLKPWRILAFNPSKGILEVVDPEGKPVSKDDLWFHKQMEWAKAKETLGWLRDSVTAIRVLQWQLAAELARAKTSQVYLAGGYNDLYEFTHELGISSSKAKRMIRLHRFVSAEVDDPRICRLDPDIVSLLRRVPRAKRSEMIETFLGNPLPVAMKEYNDLYGEERMKTFRTFRADKGKVVFHELRALTEDEVKAEAGAVVMRGGSVIMGAVSSETEEVSP